MAIRLAGLDDVTAIDELVQGAYAGYIESIGRRPVPMDADYLQTVRRGEAYVAGGDRVVGLIVLVREPDHLLIENVAVDPRRQGQGVGRALLAYAEQHARECGLWELRLYTHRTMTRNLRLYGRLGYVQSAGPTDDDPRVFLSRALA